jgi:LysM repeat protein
MERAAHASVLRLPRSLVACVIAFALVAGCSSHGSSTTSGGSGTSTSVSVAATTTTTLPQLYRVRAGDTLTAIAQRLRVSAAAIIERNNVSNPNRLTVGQTLVIPPRPPLSLVVTPPRGHVGDGFELRLTGAAPGETIVFAIQSPKGIFTGRPHTAPDGGAVSATYQTSFGDGPGVYKVTATGDRGTVLRAEFRVFAALA